MNTRRTKRFIVLALVVALLIILGLSVQATGGHGIERAIAAQEAHTDQLLARPGVVGTGVGLGADGKPVIRIYIEAPGIAGLPSRLEGVPVDVVMTGRFHALFDRTARHRPAPIGVSTGHPDITAGTIGARVVDGAGNVYALSNNHVYANSNNATIGDGVLQPGSYDGGSASDDQIGTLFAFQEIFFDGSDNTMDAAIALSSREELNNATSDEGYGMPSSLSERQDFSVGEIDDRLMPCLSHSSELIAGSMTNDSQV